MNTDKPITACRLWQRTSAAGRVYLTGRLGSLRVLIFENTSNEGDHSHNLLFAQADDRPAQQTQQRPDLDAAQQTPSNLRPSSPPPARRFPTGAASAPRGAAKVSMAGEDSEIPF